LKISPVYNLFIPWFFLVLFLANPVWVEPIGTMIFLGFALGHTYLTGVRYTAVRSARTLTPYIGWALLLFFGIAYCERYEITWYVVFSTIILQYWHNVSQAAGESKVLWRFTNETSTINRYTSALKALLIFPVPLALCLESKLFQSEIKDYNLATISTVPTWLRSLIFLGFALLLLYIVRAWYRNFSKKNLYAMAHDATAMLFLSLPWITGNYYYFALFSLMHALTYCDLLSQMNRFKEAKLNPNYLMLFLVLLSCCLGYLGLSIHRHGNIWLIAFISTIGETGHFFADGFIWKRKNALFQEQYGKPAPLGPGERV
jgi:hypothetical protein